MAKYLGLLLIVVDTNLCVLIGRGNKLFAPNIVPLIYSPMRRLMIDD